LDHHTTDKMEVGRDALPAETARLINLVKPDVIQIHAKGNPGWATYPSKAGFTPPQLARDVMQVWAGVARENGYVFSAYYNIGRDREIMKRHPLNGLAMLLETDLPLFVKKAVLHHHEDFHGGGYPMSLEGPNITVLARLLRIIDVFDAMTSRRPYKDPMRPRQAAQIMIGEREDRDAEEGEDERDLGMRQCFDRELLKKFIVFLGNVRLDA